MKILILLLTAICLGTPRTSVNVVFKGHSKIITISESLPYLDARAAVKELGDYYDSIDFIGYKDRLKSRIGTLKEFDFQATERDFYMEGLIYVVSECAPEVTVIIDSSIDMVNLAELRYNEHILAINKSLLLYQAGEVIALVIFHELIHVDQLNDGELIDDIVKIPVCEVVADVVSYSVYRDIYGQPNTKFHRWYYSHKGLMKPFDSEHKYYSFLSEVIRHMRSVTLKESKHLIGGHHVRY